MQLSLSNPLKQVARVGALAVVGALTLGATATSGATGAGLTAHSSTLNPQPAAKQPSAPVIEEAVVEQNGAVEMPKNTVKANWGDGSGDFWGRLRKCESGGNYSTNTGNGYYGAYQYNDSTWGGYGGYKHASDAPPEVQDQKAKETYAKRGASPWPVCGRR